LLEWFLKNLHPMEFFRTLPAGKALKNPAEAGLEI
jgi:hypothetical protein